MYCIRTSAYMHIRTSAYACVYASAYMHIPSARVVSSLPTPEVLLPTLIVIENPALLSW